MSVRTAAALLWGLVIGYAILYALDMTTIRGTLGATFTMAVFLILSVLWDEWRHPATGYTLRGRP